jgi:hypothetical protein
MITSFGHLRRSVLLALTWAVAWAPLGVLFGVIVDPNDSMDEPWIAVGAYPGFLCGVLFCAALWIVDRRRRLDEWPLSRAGLWGGVSSLMLMLILSSSFLGTPNTEHLFWRWRFMIFAAIVLLSVISAVVSAQVAKRVADKRESRNGGFA